MTDLSLFKSFAPKDDSIRVSGNNCVIYTRVSDSSQQDNTSLASQKKYCEQYAQKRGLHIIEYFGGTHESAKTDERKEFKKMLKFIKQSKGISYIIVYSCERFSRSGIGGAKIADDLLKDYGIVTLAVTQELDPTTSSGSFQQKVLFLFGQMDNEMRRNKTITGMSELIEKGYTPYSVPKGFVNLNKGKCVNQNIVVSEEGKLIRKAFLWKAKKKLSNAEICRKLKRLGLTLDERRLAEIFSNPYYCGLIVSKLLPGQVVEGRHEPLVSKELFLKVNDIITNKRNHPIQHKDTDDNLPLKVFLKCEDCGTPMTGYLVKKKNLYYYKCRKKGCRHNESAKSVHQQFSDLLSIFHIEKEDMDLVKTSVETYFEAIFEEKKQEQVLSKRKISELKGQIDTIEERYALGRIEGDIYMKFKDRFSKELKEIVDKSLNYTKLSSNLKKCLDYAFNVCANPSKIWTSGNIEDKIRLQNIVFPEGISIDKQKRQVRTQRINSLFAPIAQIIRELRKTKNGQPLFLEQLSAWVTTAGFKPATF